MTPELEKLQALMLHHAKNVMLEYHEQWMPSSEHIAQGLELFKPPMAGFEGYSVDDAIKRNDAFFRCKESWTVGPRHNFSVFVKHFQRWIPAVKPSEGSTRLPAKPSEGSQRCPDHPKQFLVNGICPVCFPMCGKCGFHHETTETCEDFKQRDDWVRRTFGQPSEGSHGSRGNPSEGSRGNTTTLAGEEVFDEKAKKEIKDIRMQEERRR